MTQKNHSPLPWRMSEIWRPPFGNYPYTPEQLNANGEVFHGYSISVSNEHGADILPEAAIINVQNFPNEVHANAEFMVSAVNNHYELLEALKYARRFLKSDDVDTAYIDSVIYKAESPT